MNAVVKSLAQMGVSVEQCFQEICNSVPVSLALIDLDYRYILANKHYAATFFMEPHELYGKAIYDIVGRYIFDTYTKPNFDRAVNGEVRRFRAWVNQPARGDCFLEVYYAPYKDKNGKICGAVVCSSDVTDIKKQEMLLGRYEQIVNTVTDVMVFVNGDYRYEAVNERFLEVFGFSREDVVGRQQIEIVGEENFTRISKPSVDRALTGETVRSKTWSFQKNMGERYMNFCYAPCLGINGEIDGVIVTSQDITESIRAEIDLDLYNAIMNASADYLTIIDLDFRYLMVNQRYADAFFMNREKMIGMHLSEVLGEKGFNEVSVPNITACLNKGKHKVSCWVTHPSGGKRYLNLEYTVHKGPDGKVLSVLVAGHDVTELYESRNRLEAREKSLLKAQKIAGLGTWERDLETDKMIVSDETIRIMSNNFYDANWLSSFKNFRTLFHPEDKEMINDAINHSNKTGDGFTLEHRIIWPDGTIRWTLIQANLEYKDGKACRVVGVTMDVTKRKEADDEIRRLNEKLEERVKERTSQLVKANSTLHESLQQLKDTQNQLIQSEKMASLGNLVAGVAHEINTPIGMCVSTASFMQDRLKKWLELYQLDNFSREDFDDLLKTSTESMDILMSNLTRAADLIRSFKQVAVDQSSEKMRRIFMRQYLEEVIKSLNPELKHKHHSIELDCPEEINLITNPGAISQIVTNLIMNSLIHGFELIHGGKIMITVSIQDNLVKLVYKDNGKGIPEEHVGKIFEPFFTTKRGSGGSGLGMHIVFNLVNQTLRGNIQCRSKLDDGVVFTITFPLCTETQGWSQPIAVSRKLDDVSALRRM